MIEITGDKELDAKLLALGQKEARKVAASAIRKGMTVISKAIKAEVKATFKSKTGNLHNGIGARLKRISSPENVTAKVGVGVGPAKAMAKKLAGAAAHLHLLALGTQERQTKAGHPTGKVQPNDFVDRGFTKSESAAKDKIIDSLWQGIEKAATKK